MIEILKEHPKAVMFAGLFHVLVIIVVGVSVDWTSMTKPSGENKPVKIISAVAVDQALVEKELKKIKQAEKKRIRKQKDAERRKKKAIADRKREEKKLKELKKQSKKEKAKQKALKTKRKADLKLEKVRKLKVKKQQKQKRAAEQKKAAELAEQKRIKEQFENELKRKLDKEENERKVAAAVANEARKQKEEGKYVDKIVRDIQNSWNSPSKYSGKKVTVEIKAIPSGDVLNVRIVKSSGDPIYDRDVEKAINKASPLPTPPAGSELFDAFRKFEITIVGRKKS